MSKPVKAFLFDLNGTLVDDMYYHAKAWYDIITEELNASLSWDEVKVQMYGKNKEVLDRIFGKDHFTEAEVVKWSVEKEKRYQSGFRPHIKLIDGLEVFLQQAADKQIKMAVASAAIRENIDFILDNLELHNYFKAIVSAEDVTISKPHPETFLKAASLLGSKPEECIVFEDAPKGVEAAQNAGMKSIVITTTHPEEDFIQYEDSILAFIKDYNDPFIQNYFI